MNAAAGATDDVTVNLTGQDLGGQVLTPGIYQFASSAQLTGTLILDGQGQTNPTFIFQIGSTLTTASNAEVNLINGAGACAVFWQIGSSATLGTYTDFQGNLMAAVSITLTTGATIGAGGGVNGGRALALAAVTMDSNTITLPSGDCAYAPLPTPVPDPTPPPIVEPTPTPVIDPTPTPIVEPTPTPVIDPTPTPIVDPTPKPIIVPINKPVITPKVIATPIKAPLVTPLKEQTTAPLLRDSINLSDTAVPLPEAAAGPGLASILGVMLLLTAATTATRRRLVEVHATTRR